MKTIVFINTQKSGSSREAIKAAQKLGYYTVLLTNRHDFLECRSEFQDVKLMQLCDLDNIAEITKTIRQLIFKSLDICAVVSFVEPYYYTACLVAEEFGVNRFSTQAILNMQDKLGSRQLLSQSPYCPDFIKVSENSPLPKSEIDGHFPLVMKSPCSFYSKDVFKANAYDEYECSMKKLFKKYPGKPVLAEEYLDGQQYLIQAFVYRNELHIAAVIRQEVTYCNSHFIVTGYSLQFNLQDIFYKSLRIAVESIVKSHGLELGACHLEMHYIKGHWKLIDIDPMISGSGTNALIEIGTGINVAEEILKLSLGQRPNIKLKHKQHAYAKYVIVSETGALEKVTGRNRALKCAGVKTVHVRPWKGSVLTPPESTENRYAYVIAVGNCEEEAKQNAQHAASQIQFHLLPANMKKNKIEKSHKCSIPNDDCEKSENHCAKNHKIEDTISKYKS